MTKQSNEAGVDHDYEAAVIQLRQGHRKSLIKFCAIILLLGILVGCVGVLVFSIGGAVQAVIGV